MEEGEVLSEDEGEAYMESPMSPDEGDDGSEDEVFSEDEAEAVRDEFEHMESPMSPDQ